MHFKEVSVDMIEDQDLKRSYTDVKFQELVKSIADIGIIQPIVIAHSGEHYKLIVGQRRLAAARALSKPTVPCRIIMADHEQAISISLHENLYREDMNDVEEALLYAYLRDSLKYSNKKTAKMIGKSDSYVSQHLDILTYLPEIILAIRKQEISFSVARELSQITDKRHALYLLKHAAEDGATQRTVRYWVQSWRASKIAEQLPPGEEEPLPFSPNYMPPKLACAICGEYHEPVKLTTWLVCPKCVRECTKPAT